MGLQAQFLVTKSLATPLAAVSKELHLLFVYPFARHPYLSRKQNNRCFRYLLGCPDSCSLYIRGSMGVHRMA